MTVSRHTVLCTARLILFMLHNAVLVPGIVFWGLVLMLHGDAALVMAFIENLTSRFAAAGINARAAFLGDLALVFAALLIFVTLFRWPLFQLSLMELKEGDPRTGRARA